MATAARSNPDLLAARNASRSGHERLAAARSAWRPSVQLGVTNGITRTVPKPNQRFIPTPAFGDFELPPVRNPAGLATTRNLKQADLSVSYNLYRSGQSTATLRRASVLVLRGHALVEDAEQTLLLRVAAAYLDTVHRTRVVELRRASLAFFEEQLRETEAQFRIGDRTGADLKQAEAERDVAGADVTTAEAELATQRSLFEALVGIPPLGLEEAAMPGGLPSGAADARRMAEADHPAVGAAAHALRAAEHGVRAAKGAIGPRVDLRGGLSRSWIDTDPSSSSDGYTDEATIGFQVTLPLYEGGASSARLREAKWLRAQRRDELSAARREASRRAVDAWHRLASARKRLVALTAAVAASEAALSSIRREADVGERTTKEVLDAERIRVARRIAALAAKSDVVLHAYGLASAVGGLTAQRLSIDGVPDLVREARDAARNLKPGLLSILDR